VGVAISHFKLGLLEMRNGRPSRASLWIEMSDRQLAAVGHKQWLADVLQSVAELALMVGLPEDARKAMRAADDLRAVAGLVRSRREDDGRAELQHRIDVANQRSESAMKPIAVAGDLGSLHALAEFIRDFTVRARRKLKSATVPRTA
jgi:hypothetical protein